MTLIIRLNKVDEADFRRACGLRSASYNEVARRCFRQFVNEIKLRYPDQFQENEVSLIEESILELIDDGLFDRDEIAKELRLTKPKADKLLEGLATKGLIEKRKRAKTDKARGKQPEIWVRV